MATQKRKWVVNVGKDDCNDWYAMLTDGGWPLWGDSNSHRFLTGMFTPMRYWFRSLEHRVEKATNELLDYASHLDREVPRDDVARLNEIARGIVDKR